MASQSTGKRVFSIVSIIISGLVLVFAVATIIGTWTTLGTVIDIATGVLEGVDQLAQVARNGTDRLDIGLTNLHEGLDEVTLAIDKISQNVEDKGLIITLLPPEKEQKLENTAERLSDGITSVKGTIEAAIELKQAIDRIPFVDLPQLDPQKVQATEESINSIRSDIDELAADIQDFREGAATDISKLSTATSNISDRLETPQENVAQINSRLEALQTAVNRLKANDFFKRGHRRF